MSFIREIMLKNYDISFISKMIMNVNLSYAIPFRYNR